MCFEELFAIHYDILVRMHFDTFTLLRRDRYAFFLSSKGNRLPRSNNEKEMKAANEPHKVSSQCGLINSTTSD